MARRARPGVTPNLAAILRDIEIWESKINLPDGATVDYTFEYVWIGPQGKRQEIVKEQLTSGFGDDWPMPGEYEITALDSNGEPIEEPWRATHFDKDSLSRGRPEDGPAALMLAMSEDARITIRNQRASIESAERREKTAKQELNIALDQIADLMRKQANLTLTAERAVADKDLAEGRQKEAEDAYAQLENDILEFRPHVQIAVDHGMARLGQILGVATDNVANSIGAGATDSPSETSSQETYDGADPPPPGCEKPMESLDELYEKIIYNPALCRYLVENGVISWDLVRRLIWLRRHVDLGDTPVWDDAETQDGTAAAPPEEGGDENDPDRDFGEAEAGAA